MPMLATVNGCGHIGITFIFYLCDVTGFHLLFNYFC